jgi:tRNA(Arg) A34 adenosine deaminase TadA
VNKKTRNNHHEITAFIYDKRGRVLSIGKNSYIKTHPYQAKCAEEVGEGYKVFLHAEIDAINKCTNLDKAHRISIFRFTNLVKSARMQSQRSPKSKLLNTLKRKQK